MLVPGTEDGWCEEADRALVRVSCFIPMKMLWGFAKQTFVIAMVDRCFIFMDNIRTLPLHINIEIMFLLQKI